MTETYSYDAEGSRIRRTRGSTTTAFIEGGIWDEIAGGGATTTSSMFNGSVLAQRTTSGSTSTVVYLHGDHPSAALRACIGSVSATTTSAGGILNRQEYDPWGAIRSGDLPETVRDFTGQRRDDTGFGSSYTDMGSGRFVSADGARQVRMGDSDILGHHGGGPHINFEDRIPNPMKPGKMMPTNNRHIYLEP